MGDAQLREKEISLEASGFCGDCTNGSKDIEVLLPEDVAECRFLLSNVVIEDSLGLHAFEEEKVC